MISNDRGLSEEQRMMRDAIRAFVDDFVTPFIRKNWQREWDMNPENRLPREILEQARTRSASARSAFPRNSAARRSIPRPRCRPSP